ncbi:hypothetical protein OTU49_011734 [Cherax quadricarinatus]|uniref:Uncharacterized protein n=1 Tax=Cherax quadricarinatus TaxID=27406 RepID=A0AAW0YPM8_CHEQU|nr:uncharacterized protein LOC128685068 [Cherax quadricarinatus]
MNRRVAWLLLFTYGILLILGGFGMWVSIQLVNHKSTATDRPDTRGYVNYYQDPRFYLIVPSGVSIMVAAVIVMAGICSRKIFATTVGLHSSLGLWIVILLTAVQYQAINWKPDDHYFLPTFPWVLGLQVGLLLLLALQVVLAMWELRRQEAGWPNVYFAHLFTVEILFLIARVTLGVFTVLYLSASQMMYGLHNRYPEYYVLPCIVASLFGVITSSEGFLSLLFGKVQGPLMTCNALISAIGYAGLAIVTSPVFVRAVISPYIIYSEVMIFSSVSSIVSFIHAIICLVFPRGVRTPPKFISAIAKKLSEIEFSSDDFNIREAFSSSSAAMSNAAVILRSKCQEHNALFFNVISSAVSFLAIILASVAFGTIQYEGWSLILLLCGDVSIFSRSTAAGVTEMFYGALSDEPTLLKCLQLILEESLLLCGVIGSFCSGHSLAIASGVVSLTLALFQIYRMVVHFTKENTIISTFAVASTGPEDTKPLHQADPETAQDLSDDKHPYEPSSCA